MRSLRAARLLAGLVLGGAAVAAGAQQPARAPVPREQLHPELVDSTWGPRTQAAWQLALSHHWEDARAQFTELHALHPSGLEAIVGLGFVARAMGDREDALRWLRQVYAAEPSEDVRRQIEAVEWDRPGRIEATGDATRVGSTTNADWSLAAVIPVVPAFTLTARVGVLGAADPLRGVFLDSTSGQARVVSAGAVVRPTETLALSTRAEYWTSPGEHQTFMWLDATQRLDDHFAVRIGARPIGGSTGGARFNGGADIIFVPGQALTVDVAQGAHAAPFEARTQIGAFYLAIPSPGQMVRVGVLRDMGPTNQATTGFIAATRLFTPILGLSAQVSTRQGTFAQSSAGGGLVVRW